MTTYTCNYCGKTLYVENGIVETCQCPQIIQAEYEQKERDRLLNNQNKVSFDTARKNNKVKRVREQSQ
jgi:hypothetical protein